MTGGISNRGILFYTTEFGRIPLCCQNVYGDLCRISAATKRLPQVLQPPQTKRPPKHLDFFACRFTFLLTVAATSDILRSTANRKLFKNDSRKLPVKRLNEPPNRSQAGNLLICWGSNSATISQCIAQSKRGRNQLPTQPRGQRPRKRKVNTSPAANREKRQRQRSKS